MKLQLIRKGTLYFADCYRCGTTNYTHEFVHDDHNERRELMENGKLVCSECAIGYTDKATFGKSTRPQYAARFSSPGYLDCTDWMYGSNKRELVRELKQIYGSEG